MNKRWVTVMVLATVLAGCLGGQPPALPSAPAPSPSPTALSSASTSGDARGTASPGPLVDHNTLPAAYVLERGSFPTSDTTPLQDAKTDGTVIVWSCGVGAAPFSAPDLWEALPGGTPRRIFANPNRDSALLPIVVAGGHVAFVEGNERLYGSTGGWRLWYLDHPGARVVLLDASNGPSPLPILAMTSERIVWATFHGPEGHVVSDLITVSLPGLAKRILGHSPKSQRQYVFPSLRGSLLAYGVEVPGTGAEHVVLVDLSKPGAIPRQLDSSGNATTPTLTADSVIWKEAPNIVDAGQLVRYSLRDRSTTQLNLGTWSSATLPSAGRRFATAWGTDSTQFYLVDLTNNRPILLEGFSPTGPLNDVRPYISGDLLVWIRGVSSLTASGYPTQPLELEWARLVP